MSERSTIKALLASILGLSLLAGCVSEEELAKIQERRAANVQLAQSQYFPNVKNVVEYCIDFLQNGGDQAPLLLQSGFERNDGLFGGVAYSAVWEAASITDFDSSVVILPGNNSCTIRLKAIGIDPHRAEINEALRNQGFELTSISPEDPTDSDILTALRGGFGISVKNVQYARRDNLILEIALVSSPGGRQNFFIDESIRKVDRALLPFG